jgi:FAD/FMN-containing dehydrogenase
VATTGMPLPHPVVRRPEPYVDVAALQRDLRERVDGEVRFDPGSRGAYSTDASNYRQVPIGVVVPRTVEAGAEAVAVCRRHGAPVVSRGGGTSLAGQSCNVAVVIDWSKYCHAVVSVDTAARTCVVEPGIVLDELNAALAGHGLMFGPRPATHDHCTLGGMIGNNSCGATAQAYGKTVENVVALEVLTYGGERFWAGAASDGDYERIVAAGGWRGQAYQALRELAGDRAGLIRERYPKIPRRVSGYNLDSLLPEGGFHVGRALVGSESTLVTILRAELTLVPVPAGARAGAGRRPRGSPRRHGPGTGHARHLGRLGGLGGPAGPAGRLPAGPEEAVRRVRLFRLGAVRSLRPGLRAHPDSV